MYFQRTGDDHEMHARLADLANGVHKRFRDERQAMDLVREVVRGSELVFAVWQDAGPDGPASTEHDGERVPFKVRGGVAAMVVKGEPVLRFISETDVREELTMAAVPCSCIEQAIALRDAVRRGTMP
jgi:hypothetical protein